MAELNLDYYTARIIIRWGYRGNTSENGTGRQIF